MISAVISVIMGVAAIAVMIFTHRAVYKAGYTDGYQEHEREADNLLHRVASFIHDNENEANVQAKQAVDTLSPLERAGVPVKELHAFMMALGARVPNGIRTANYEKALKYYRAQYPVLLTTAMETLK